MNFIGATRKQAGKSINDDAFTVFSSSTAFLMDGAGNARGAAKRCLEIVRQQYQQYREMPAFQQLLNLLNMNLTGFGAESTFLGIQVTDSTLSGVSVGDSLLWVVREGQLLRINEIRKPRLGAGLVNPNWLEFTLKKHDVILAASDGLTLDHYRLVQLVQRFMLRPQEMPQAILDAQKDASDDCTVITGVV